MSADEVDADRRQAEVFDALGHPTRIMILKALSEGSLGFADLKKKLGIESSGHLQHHLSKLGSLVKTDDYGKYVLSGQGKDALLSVETVEKVAATEPRQKQRNYGFKRNILLKSAVVALTILLVTTSVLFAFEYKQASSFQDTINKTISQYETALELTSDALTINPPNGSFYLPESATPNGVGNLTRIFLLSSETIWIWEPANSTFKPVPAASNGWVNFTTVIRYGTPTGEIVTVNETSTQRQGTFISPRVFISPPWFAGPSDGYGWSIFPSQDPVLEIGVTVRNDYTSADAGNGSGLSSPIGSSTAESFIMFTAKLYSSNGSLIQTQQLTPPYAETRELTLLSGQTKPFTLFFSPDSLQIDHYEIYVSYLSSVPLP